MFRPFKTVGPFKISFFRSIQLRLSKPACMGYSPQRPKFCPARCHVRIGLSNTHSNSRSIALPSIPIFVLYSEANHSLHSLFLKVLKQIGDSSMKYYFIRIATQLFRTQWNTSLSLATTHFWVASPNIILSQYCVMASCTRFLVN